MASVTERHISRRWSPWARHLEPRWRAQETEHARAATLLPNESPRVSDTDSWGLDVTQYTLQRRRPKRPCALSAASACVALLNAMLQASTAPLLAISIVFSLHCLFKHRCHLSHCANKHDFNFVPDPFLAMAVGYTLSVVQCSLLVGVLFYTSRHAQPYTGGDHLDMLPLSKIRTIVSRTRKFWTLLFIVVGGATSDLYTAFGQIRLASGARPNTTDAMMNHIYIRNTGTQQWMYVGVTGEKILLVLAMCLVNYAKPSARAPYLTLYTFYSSLLFYALENSFWLLQHSYHITFKVLPGHSSSILSMERVTNGHERFERAESMAILVLLTLNTMCRASFAKFFFSKLFEPSKDFFHTVDYAIPLPEPAEEDTAQDVQLGSLQGRQVSTLPTITE